MKINLLSVKDNLKVLQSFEKTCTAYKPNIDELEDINQVTYLHSCVEKSHHCNELAIVLAKAFIEKAIPSLIKDSLALEQQRQIDGQNEVVEF